MPIEPGDSWFSPKWIEVQPFCVTLRVTEGSSWQLEVGSWMGEGARRLPSPTKP